jgi:hypothetical protein
MTGKRILFSIFAAASLAGIAIFAIHRFQLLSGPSVSPQVGERLPMSKNLQTIPDHVGNYDIDGVSFDTEGVIIASDNLKNVQPII